MVLYFKDCSLKFFKEIMTLSTKREKGAGSHVRFVSHRFLSIT